VAYRLRRELLFGDVHGLTVFISTLGLRVKPSWQLGTYEPVSNDYKHLRVCQGRMQRRHEIAAPYNILTFSKFWELVCVSNYIVGLFSFRLCKPNSFDSLNRRTLIESLRYVFRVCHEEDKKLARLFLQSYLLRLLLRTRFMRY